MLELRGATYRYAGYATEVLHEVDLRLDDGEIVGLVGPNEAGKSTLCLVASGLAPASVGGSLKGTLTLDQRPAAGLSTHELAERVVVGFQNPNTQRSSAPKYRRRHRWVGIAVSRSIISSRVSLDPSGGQPGGRFGSVYASM